MPIVPPDMHFSEEDSRAIYGALIDYALALVGSGHAQPSIAVAMIAYRIRAAVDRVPEGGQSEPFGLSALDLDAISAALGLRAMLANEAGDHAEAARAAHLSARLNAAGTTASSDRQQAAADITRAALEKAGMKWVN